MANTVLPTTRTVDSEQIEGVVQQLAVARRYTVKLSEIIQEQGRDLDGQAAALEAAASQAQQDKHTISQLKFALSRAPHVNSDALQSPVQEANEETLRLRGLVQELQEAAVRDQQHAQQAAVELMQLTVENRNLLNPSSNQEELTTKDELMQSRAAYEELRMELRKVLLDRAELQQSAPAELALELEELSRKLKDCQQACEQERARADSNGAQVVKLKQVAETMQEHNTRLLEQLNANSVQIQTVLDSNKEERATIEAAHQAEVSKLKFEIQAQHSRCEELTAELQQVLQERDDLKVTQEQHQPNTALIEALKADLSKQENKHNQQLEILAQEKEQARKVVNDCLDLSTERDKEAASLKHDLSNMKLLISQQQNEISAREERHQEQVAWTQSQLQQEMRERLLLERQLAEITKSVDYARHQIPPQDSMAEISELQSRVHELTTKNRQLHQHATRKSQESEVLQASLNLLSRPQEPTTNESTYSRSFPRQEQVVDNGVDTNGSRNISKIADCTHMLQQERKNLDDENDAIKMRIVELVDRLEGQLHSPTSNNATTWQREIGRAHV